MGVWQMIEDRQPYVGQWDAVTDSFWDGMCWVDYYSYMARNRAEFGMDSPASVLKIPTPKMMWPSVQAYYMQYYAPGLPVTSEPLCTPEEAPKAQDPWEALKSMF